MRKSFRRWALRTYYRHEKTAGLKFCRLGLHIMVMDFLCDRYACACTKAKLNLEDVR